MTAEPLWITADKRVLRLSDMETSHIRNSIAKIRRSFHKHGLAGWRLQFLKPLIQELERRGLADNKSLNPAQLSNRFRNLDIS